MTPIDMFHDPFVVAFYRKDRSKAARIAVLGDLAWYLAREEQEKAKTGR